MRWKRRVRTQELRSIRARLDDPMSVFDNLMEVRDSL